MKKRRWGKKKIIIVLLIVVIKYSNFGMATLGAVLEQVYDEDYTTLMNHYISEELGLKNTKISDVSGDLKKK